MSKKKVAHNGDDWAPFDDTPQDLQDSQDLQGSQDKQRPPGVESQFDRGGAEPLSLSLPKYVEWAIQYTDSDSDLEESMHGEQWHSPMFAFTRLCRAHPAIAELSDVEAMQTVEKVLCGLPSRQRLTPRADPWQRAFPFAGDADDIKRDFMSSWISVRFVPFRDILGSAAELAKRNLLASSQDRGKLYRQFISLAGALQVLMGNRPIMLPTRKVALLLGCNPRTVSDLRKFAIQDRLLVVTQPHSFQSSRQSKNMATEFHFAIERFNIPDKP